MTKFLAALLTVLAGAGITALAQTSSAPVDVPITINQVTLTQVALSNGSFSCSAPSGTVIGTLNGVQNIGAYTGSFSTSTPGFQIVGNQLQTSGTPAGCPTSYGVVVTASLPTGVVCGLPGSCFQTLSVGGGSGGSSGNLFDSAAYTSSGSCTVTSSVNGSSASGNVMTVAGGGGLSNGGASFTFGTSSSEWFNDGYGTRSQALRNGGTTGAQSNPTFVMKGVEYLIDNTATIWLKYNSFGDWYKWNGTAWHLSLTSPTITTVPEPAWLSTTSGASATAIAITAPTSDTYAQSALTITADMLPLNGTVMLADGITPVTVGQTLTAVQLAGLKFLPTTLTQRKPSHSSFGYTVCDPAGQLVFGNANFTVYAANIWADPPGQAVSGTVDGEVIDATPIVLQPTVPGDVVGLRFNPGGAEAAGYKTFGHVFMMGTVQTGNTLCIRPGSNAASCSQYVQMDVKNTWPDGSVKHAALTTRLPSISASPGYWDALIGKCAGAGPIIAGGCPTAPSPAAVSAATLAASAYSVSTTETFSAGASGSETQACKTILSHANASTNGATILNWLSGPAVNEFDVRERNFAGGQGWIECDIKVYADTTTKTQIIYDHSCFKNCSVTPADLTYTVSVSDGFTNGAAAIAQYKYSRWMHEVDVANTGSVINPIINYDMPYLSAAGANLPFDYSLGFDHAQAGTLHSGGVLTADAPMSTGSYTTDMGTVGARPDIGPETTWTMACLTGGLVTSCQDMHRMGLPAGTVSWNLTDQATGKLFDADTFPTDINGINTPPDSSGQAGYPWAVGQNGLAHQPEMNYMPYLFSADHYRWLLLASQASYSITLTRCSRTCANDMSGVEQMGAMAEYAQSLGFDGYDQFPASNYTQPRQLAWDEREIAKAAFAVPDTDALKTYFQDEAARGPRGLAQVYAFDKLTSAYGVLGGGLGFTIGANAGKPGLWQTSGFFPPVMGMITNMAMPKASAAARRLIYKFSQFSAGGRTSGELGFDPLVFTTYYVYTASNYDTPTSSSTPLGSGTWQGFYNDNVFAGWGGSLCGNTGFSGFPPATEDYAKCTPDGSAGIGHQTAILYGTSGYPYNDGGGALEGYPQVGLAGAGMAYTLTQNPQVLAEYAFLSGAVKYLSQYQGTDLGEDANYRYWPANSEKAMMPDGVQLDASHIRKDGTNSSVVNLTCPSVTDCMLAIHGNGTKTFNSASIGNYDIFADATVYPYTPVGTSTMTAGSPNSFMFGSCAPTTMNAGTGHDLMAPYSSCFSTQRTAAANTFRLRNANTTSKTKQIGYLGLDGINRSKFRPGTDTLNFATNYQGSGITNAAGALSICATVGGDAVFTFPNSNTLTLKGVACNAANLSTSITVN